MIPDGPQRPPVPDAGYGAFLAEHDAAMQCYCGHTVPAEQIADCGHCYDCDRQYRQMPARFQRAEMVRRFDQLPTLVRSDMIVGL